MEQNAFAGQAAAQFIHFLMLKIFMTVFSLSGILIVKFDCNWDHLIG